MKAKPIPLEVYAGETGPLRFGPVVVARTGMPLDMLSATAIELQVRKHLREPGQADDDADNPVIFSKTLADDDISLESTTVTVNDVEYPAHFVLVDLEVEDTTDLKGAHAYDCVADFSGNQRRYVALPATFTVIQTVNGAVGP